MSHAGNMANSVNGKANAIEKPNIPTAGAAMLPDVENSASSSPMIGAVQEKETSTSVNAIRKIESSPLVAEALLSTELVHLDGSSSSNHPKNDTANTTNTRKMMMLKTAFVDKLFNPLPPEIRVMRNPSSTYITMIDTPYVIASRMPFALSLFLFRKKLTVIGMIGQMQGMSTARRPPTKPMMRM